MKDCRDDGDFEGQRWPALGDISSGCWLRYLPAD